MEDNKLSKKYGLLTAICMVIGIVIGSGVYFKAEVMLDITKGDLPIALFSWLGGGLVMVISSYVWAVMAGKFEKISGVVDYSEALVGKGYSYFVGWFMATIYFPAMTSALAWLSARYTLQAFGFEAGNAVVSAETMTLAAFYLIVAFAVNTIAPRIAGYFQVSTTIIKLIPLALMAVVGIVYGIVSGCLTDNFQTVVVAEKTVNSTGLDWSLLIPGICTSVFAYEGWVCATSINSEIKDSKKNLPRALVLGTVVVVVVYILYYLGISGAVPTVELLTKGGASYAFVQRFGSIAGTVLTFFIAISCLGTLNGLTSSCTRSFYALADRNWGPKPEYLGKLDAATNMPTNASIIALIFNAAWMLYFYIANLSPISEKMGIFAFDSTELPLIAVYAFYLPMYIMFIAKAKELNGFKRFVMPILAFLGACLFIYAAINKHGIKNIGFLAVFAVIMVIGAFFYYSKDKTTQNA